MAGEQSRVTLSESDIQRSIVAYLRARGIPFTVTDAGMTRHRGAGKRVTRGWPDISGVLPGGRFLAIEVKREKGVLSPEQVTLHERLRKAGALVVVARQVEDVIGALDERK